MEKVISSIKLNDKQPDTMLPTKDACRICWNQIIGEGFHFETKVNQRIPITYAEMYLHVSEVEPVDDPELLCWGCAKILRTAYKMMKKVEEKEKIVNEPKRQKKQTNGSRKREAVPEDIKPVTTFEMVVIKVEPQDFSDLDSGGNEISDHEYDEPVDFSPDDDSDEDFKVDDEVKPKPDNKLQKSSAPQGYIGYKTLIQCALCYYNTRNKENYHKHVTDHHNQQQLKCDGCEEIFRYIYELETHRKELHNATEKYVVNLLSNSLSATSESREEQKVVLKHEIIDAPLDNPPKVPEEKLYKFDCLGRKIPINRAYTKGEVKWPRKERKLPIQCPLCPYTGIGKSNFRNHYRVRHNKQELQCDGCDAKFHLFYRLYRHREEEHKFSHEYVVDESLKVKHETPKEPKPRKEEKDFQCPQCDQVLRGARKLHEHLKEVHNYVKKRESLRVICPICGKFVVNQNLETHIRHLHPEHRDPLICHYCDDKLKSKKCMIRHMQSTHKLALTQRGSGSLVCRYCPEVFRTKHLRVAHEVRIHTLDYKHKCSLCNAKFLVKSDFTKHLNRHAKGKMKQSKLNCHICGEFFSRRKILAEHIATHFVNGVPSLSDSLAQNLAYLSALKYEPNPETNE